MTSDIAIVTANFGAYDTIKPPLPQDGIAVEWVCVTDDPASVPDGWNVVHHVLPELSPVRAAKGAKFQPWRYTAPGTTASIWVDASYRITSPRFAVETLALADPIAQFVHPWRDCVYSEAAHSRTLLKYAGEPIGLQVQEYAHLGHPRHWGLWAAGVIARQHTPEVRKMGELWQRHVDNWSHQDQISEPYVLRMCGLRPAALPGDHLTNPWLSYEGSARH